MIAEAREGLPVEPVPELVQRDVEFKSISALGKMGAPWILFAPKLLSTERPLPIGRSVCYFRISRKLWIPAGWLSDRATLTAITANCFTELSPCDFRQFGMQDVQRATNQLEKTGGALNRRARLGHVRTTRRSERPGIHPVSLSP
jgi:hypothetical protein